MTQIITTMTFKDQYLMNLNTGKSLDLTLKNTAFFNDESQRSALLRKDHSTSGIVYSGKIYDIKPDGEYLICQANLWCMDRFIDVSQENIEGTGIAEITKTTQDKKRWFIDTAKSNPGEKFVLAKNGIIVSDSYGYIMTDDTYIGFRHALHTDILELMLENKTTDMADSGKLTRVMDAVFNPLEDKVREFLASGEVEVANRMYKS